MKVHFINLRAIFFKYKLDIVLILSIAAFFRLYKIRNYMEFQGDEGRDALVAYNILHGHLTLLGPSVSVGGFFLGPVYYYFMAPFLWIFNYDPVGPAVMVALFGIATVLLIYKVGGEFFGRKAGIIASSLYAISPLMIIYSSSSWNPWLLPFFSLLALYTLYKGQIKNKLLFYLATGLFLGIAVQLHYTALFLLPIVFVYVLMGDLFMSRTYKKIIKPLIIKYLILLLGYFIAWLPFLFYEINNGFPNLRAIFNFVLNTGSSGTNFGMFTIFYDVFVNIYGRYVFGAFPPIEYLNFNGQPFILLTYLFILISIFPSFILLINKCVRVWKEKNSDFLKYNLLLTWLVLGVGFFSFYRGPFMDQVYVLLFPLPFLLVALLISFLYEYKSRFFPQKIIKAVSILIFLIIAILNLENVYIKYQHTDNVGQTESASQFILAKAGGQPFDFALITNPPNYDMAYLYFFTILGNAPVNSDTNQLFVVCERKCSPLKNNSPDIVNFGRAKVLGVWKVSGVKVYRLVHF